jgi:hypothetical protein
VVFTSFDNRRQLTPSTGTPGGTDLSFGVGSGPVLVINPFDAPIPVKLVSTQAGTFIVTSQIEGVTGRSVTLRDGRSTTQLFEFMLPPGINEFSVARASGVNFFGSTRVPLEATVYPLGAEGSQATILVTVVIVLMILVFLSRLNDHRWISTSRRQKALDQAVSKEDVLCFALICCRLVVVQWRLHSRRRRAPSDDKEEPGNGTPKSTLRKTELLLSELWLRERS